ncbi:hypothetical protein LN565_16380 [Xanthomonas euvesicatoria pv. euvesicatoria]|uniref:Uncharacterized protein n=2 Tax=Xanthomonas euvesicatoria TaxID=456327 RepID=A0A6B3KDJ1_XANEU|nr:hypothetical protein [Xanthomonas euvesicatoria]AEO42808.1 hypothetical protein XACM_2549 [Xanthomonas euvesicatoria pv. citrumelo F1]AOY66243.1 hypothetical protein BHE83_06475 [Xanthomonas euvesicatoria pv. vesicatoria str. 85-10]APO90182.1 hypothetical protein BJD11_09060 [Xanthomonas euvesicatoria]KHL59888.1 hypothetical protein XEU66b_17275 [Xanthomonas euvesicatoria]KHL64804.1 hypothetical protein XEU83M_15475 [Xanthomonas euvesicatoria]
MGAFVRSESGPLQIAFLTGQSDPASCALSAEQGAFLQQLQGAGRQLLDCNYPYRRNGAPHRRTPLWRASLSNARQYLAARHARLAEADRKRVHALLDQAPMTLLLAGSCGLQLLTALQLPDALRARLAVFAYGPVCDAPSVFGQLRVVQGRSDWISRTLFDGQVDARPACGHMAYLRNAEVLAECQRFVAQIERMRQGAAHAH